MPLFHRLTAAACVLAGASGALPRAAATGAAPPGVAVFYETPALPGDPARDGAAEFSVLLCVAQLRQHHPVAGLVCVGNHYTDLQFRTERTLGRVALMGVPVVKVAWQGHLPANPELIFVAARALTPAAAEGLLAECLTRYGAPPAARDPAHPTASELAALRAQVARYQRIFDASNHATQVAMR
jgi:hypothetical protein